MYTGWTATRGQRRAVFAMMIWATSQGSTRRLSVYTRVPAQPCSSAQRATSTTCRRYAPRSWSLDCGQVANTAMDGKAGWAMMGTETLQGSSLRMAALPFNKFLWIQHKMHNRGDGPGAALRRAVQQGV